MKQSNPAQYQENILNLAKVLSGVNMEIEFTVGDRDVPKFTIPQEIINDFSKRFSNPDYEPRTPSDLSTFLNPPQSTNKLGLNINIGPATREMIRDAYVNIFRNGKLKNDQEISPDFITQLNLLSENLTRSDRPSPSISTGRSGGQELLPEGNRPSAIIGGRQITITSVQQFGGRSTDRGI